MLDVLVCGAGPVGLFFALSLKQNHPDVKIRIIDSARGKSKYSKAMTIQPRTIEHLSCLKKEFFDLFLERALKSEKFILKSGKTGEDIYTVSLEGMSTPFSFMMNIPQYETEEILEMALEDLGVKVERQVQLNSFEQGKGSVVVNLLCLEGMNSTLTAEETTVECQYLIGADGGKSKVRKLLNLKFEGSIRSEVFFMADIEVQSDMLDPSCPNTFIGDTGICGFLPLPERNFYRIITNLSQDDPLLVRDEDVQVGIDQHKQDSNFNGLTVEHLEQVIKARVSREFKFSRNPRWLTTFKVNERLVERYQVDRVFLMGDAAHVHSPSGGQGMNLGLQDAFNLAWKMGLVMRNLAKESLLETYGMERRPVAYDVVSWSSRLTDTMGYSYIKKFIRSNVLIPLLPYILSLIPNIRLSEGLGQLAVHYKPNPIIHPGYSSNFSFLAGDKIKNGFRAPSQGQLISLINAPPNDEEASPVSPLSCFSSNPGYHVLYCFLFEESKLISLQDSLSGLAKATKGIVDYHLVVPANLSQSIANIRLETLWKGAWKDKDGKFISNFISGAFGFEAPTPRLVLVRPDGYISWQQSGIDPTELIEFLNSFLNLTTTNCERN